MDVLSDPVVLARIQFAATAMYHFLFVPLSIGIGLIMAIYVTKANKPAGRTNAHAQAMARFWVRIFTICFAVGVATGITMEFSFGTNWADYSRFVGPIFGAPLAAEALFAFFLESVFLGVLLFGRGKVSPRFYTVSGWLVWFGSALSALWIIIANSWMQTPAGYEVVDGRAVMTDFFAAALNNSTIERYVHTVSAVLVMGALVCLAIGAYKMLKNRESAFARSMVKVGTITGIITTIILLVGAHAQAVVVANYQPAKLAAMEGAFETGTMELSLFGWVDEANETTYTIGLPGGTSFLASGSFDTEYPGLNDFAEDERPSGVNAIYQSYHLMVALFGVIVIVLVLGGLTMAGKLKNSRWHLQILRWSWVAPMVAIQAGWFTAEFGRQPWIVQGLLKTADAASLSVDAIQLLITLVLFTVVYAFILILWIRMLVHTVKLGPEHYVPEIEAELNGTGALDGGEGFFSATDPATAETSGVASTTPVTSTGKEA